MKTRALLGLVLVLTLAAGCRQLDAGQPAPPTLAEQRQCWQDAHNWAQKEYPESRVTQVGIVDGRCYAETRSAAVFAEQGSIVRVHDVYASKQVKGLGYSTADAFKDKSLPEAVTRFWDRAK